MKNYLSFGGGVNSVAMYLYLELHNIEFEAIMVDHGTDWPETYDYVDNFISKGHPVTILKPEVNTIEKKVFENLYDYYYFKRLIPFRNSRMCTDRFKVKPLRKYQQAPAFVNLGFDYGERHRAKITTDKGFEHRYPLIEAEIDRAGCKRIIEYFGLEVPPKSGCYICPFQKVSEYKKLRREHSDLFCKVEQLEERYIERRIGEGKPPLYLMKDIPIKKVIEEEQMWLWEEDEYPPCECFL